MTNKTPYNKNLKHLARTLRKDGTKGEAILWKFALKARKMNGYQFNRQFPVGKYIVDFICRKLKLVIEIDGSSHIHKPYKDQEKEVYLKDLGYEVIRFTEGEVIFRIDDVIKEIYSVVEALEKK